jgi:hypothetical protein
MLRSQVTELRVVLKELMDEGALCNPQANHREHFATPKPTTESASPLTQARSGAFARAALDVYVTWRLLRASLVCAEYKDDE